MCEGHQFSVAETVYADVGAVRAALLNVQNFDQFTSVAHSLQALSENEFSGMGRPLFLRELVSVRLVQGSSVQGSSQVREHTGDQFSLAIRPFQSIDPMRCSFGGGCYERCTFDAHYERPWSKKPTHDLDLQG